MPARIGSPLVGMARDLARQRQKRERLFQRHVGGASAARQRRALGLLALALLHVVAEAAVAQRDLLAGRRVLAEHAHARPVALGAFGARRRQNAGELAFGIVRAADEGAVLAELQRQLPLAAERAERADRRRRRARGKCAGPSSSLRLSSTCRRAEVLDAADGAGEIVPEFAQQRLPVDLAVRDLVELLLEIGGEIVADIFGEEGLRGRRSRAGPCPPGKGASSPCRT